MLSCRYDAPACTPKELVGVTQTGEDCNYTALFASFVAIKSRSVLRIVNLT